MSNVLNFQALSHQRKSPLGVSRGCDSDVDPAPSNEEWRTRAIEQIQSSVLLLDLAAQQAHVMAKGIADRQVRQNLIRQVEVIEKLLGVARDMARKL